MTTAEQHGVLRNSAVMAAGTIFSRVSGLIRGILLAAVLGASLHAELFQIANTIPNMLYIMLAGGVFNAVLVPQLVRTAREDVDGGEAYINRVMTLSFFVLGVATVLLIVFAPVLMDQIYLADAYQTEELAKQRDSVISLARYCLPQVFFYGMFTLAGQVLNARGRFGPMMWAPIVNNIIAITVLVGYLAVYGIATGAELRGPYTERQEVFLGLGSTLGIAAQLLVLIPYLRAAGVKFRPRFDFAHPSIKHTLSLGLWTFGFVLVNQIALAVVVNLASAGPAEAPDGTGYTIYSTTFALLMLPHSVITVSLTTAILPLLSQFASEGKIAELLSTLYATLRSALVIVLPAAALLPLLAPEIARSIWGVGASRPLVELFVPAVAFWGLALPFFTVHYLSLRAFYALERTRTVFLVQVAIAATNITAALVLIQLVSPRHYVPALICAYALSYLVGSAISTYLLMRLGARVPVAWSFVPRVAAAIACCGVVAAGFSSLFRWVSGGNDAWWFAVATALGTGTFAALAYIGAARIIGLSEVNSVISTVFGRLIPKAERPA